MKELMPQRKVTAGVIASAVLYTILRIIELATGKPVPVTADDIVVFNAVLVFVIQFMVKNHEPPASTDQP